MYVLLNNGDIPAIAMLTYLGILARGGNTLGRFQVNVCGSRPWSSEIGGKNVGRQGGWLGVGGESS